jgi:Flp pilus assembly protein TadB
MNGRWIEAVLYALWAAGAGLVVITWLAWCSHRLKERRRRRIVLGPPPKESKGSALKDIPFVRRLAEDMEIAEMKVPVEAVAGLMLFIGVTGWFAMNGIVSGLRERFALDADKMIPTNTWLLSGFVALLLGSLPYFYVKFRLQRKRHRIALDMIKLAQNIIGHYSVGRTVQDIIARSSPTMPDHVRTEWRLLELQSHLQYSLEDALYEFARRTDNVWAEDLADILLIKHKYGNDVIDSLHKLVIDMQTARKNEEKRLAMVTVYRIGTTVMIAFAFFIVFFNIYADGTNYRHYFVNPTGKLALMISSVVMFVSMIMVVRSGRKTF